MYQRIMGVELINCSDEGYHRYINNILDSKMVIKTKEAQYKVTDRLSKIFEKTIRKMISEKLTLKDERILKFEVLKNGFDKKNYYREIDAIITRNGIPSFLIEIKVSRANKVKKTAISQLKESLNIAGRKWPGIRACIIYVPLFNDNWLSSDDMLEYYLDLSPLTGNSETSSNEKIPCIVLEPNEIFERSLEYGFCHEPEIWAEAKREILSSDPDENNKATVKISNGIGAAYKKFSMTVIKMENSFNKGYTAVFE